jgi:hypothetical protein
VNVKNLSIIDASVYLNNMGMVIGDWGQIRFLIDKNIKKINYAAPDNAQELFNFSSHISAWLPRSDWKLFQMDNSSHMNAYEAYLFGKLAFGNDEIINFGKTCPIFFEFGLGKESDECTEMLISNLIYLFLLFKSHGQIISSFCNSRRILSIQDGFVYFISDDSGLLEANSILEKYEGNPLLSPDWIGEIISDYQEIWK